MKDNLAYRVIDSSNVDFPEIFLTQKGMPKTIYAYGDISSNLPKISIVGTRKATTYSQQIAKEFAKQLSDNGIIVVSGLALGIDTAAHIGALEGGSPTWAILGSAIDNIYPKINEELASKIISDGGCVISEYGPNSKTFANSFILRNRLISALSSAVVVIEAPEKSGALSTAEFAKKQGKKVFVVPGPATSYQFAGSFELIRKGAILVTSVKDILSELGFENKKMDKTKHQFVRKNINESKIIDAIKNSGKSLSVDNLCQITKLNAQDINISLTCLIMDNIIKEDALGKYFIG